MFGGYRCGRCFGVPKSGFRHGGRHCLWNRSAFGVALVVLAEEIGTGRDISQPLTLNVCAPVVDAIYITNHGSSGLTAKVTLSSGGGWISFSLELGTDFSSKFLIQFGILIIFGGFLNNLRF